MAPAPTLTARPSSITHLPLPDPPPTPPQALLFDEIIMGGGGAPGLLLRGRFPDVGTFSQFQGERLSQALEFLRRSLSPQTPVSLDPPPAGKGSGGEKPPTWQIRRLSAPSSSAGEPRASPGSLAWRLVGRRGEGGLFPLLEQEVGVTERRGPCEP